MECSGNAFELKVAGTIARHTFNLRRALIRFCQYWRGNGCRTSGRGNLVVHASAARSAGEGP